MVYDWKTGNSNLLDKPEFIAAVEKGVVEKDVTVYRAGGLSSTKALEFTTRESWAKDTAEAQDRSVITIHLKKGDRALFVPLATRHHIVEVGVLLPPSTMRKYENVTNVFCPTGPGGGVDPTCSPRAHFPIEQMTEDVKESERLDLPVKKGITSKGATCGAWGGDCTNQAYLAWQRGEGDVYFGYAIPKNRLQTSYDYHKRTVDDHGPPPNGWYSTISGMIAHAWNVGDGQIIDHALGSEDAKDYVYFGKRVPHSLLSGISHGDDLAKLDYKTMEFK